MVKSYINIHIFYLIFFKCPALVFTLWFMV